MYPWKWKASLDFTNIKQNVASTFTISAFKDNVINNDENASSSCFSHEAVVEEIVDSSQDHHLEDSVLLVKQINERPLKADKDLLEARCNATAAEKELISLKASKEVAGKADKGLHEIPCKAASAIEDDIFVEFSDSDDDEALSVMSESDPDDEDLSGNISESSHESSSDASISDDDFVPKKKKKKFQPPPRTIGEKPSLNNENIVPVKLKLMEILPKGYDHKIINCTQKEDHANHYEGFIRVNVATFEDALKWVSNFESSSKTNYRVKKTKNVKLSTRVVFKKVYRCHHNTLAGKSGSKTPHEKHVGCQAEMTVTVKSTSMKWSKDELLKTHPCEVHLKHFHNHETANAAGDVLRHRRPSPEVREVFTNMFTNPKARISPSQAMNLHLENLEQSDPARLNFGDGALCPEMSWVYKLYHKIMKSQCGAPYGPEMISSLEENIKEYNEECQEVCAKLGTSVSGDNHFVAVCSPLMRRVLTHLKAAGEVMFIDSSGSMDNCNARVFVLLAPSVVCGLPVGLLITFSESEDVVTSALELWKELLPKKAFFGRGLEGPKIVISDDSTSERNSLKSCFPRATLLLCIFHVLQAMWRYVWDSKHQVRFEHRSYIYYLFREILYAPTVEEFNRLYDEALSDKVLNLSEVMVKHFKDLRSRAHEWALCYRNDLLTRGHNTNNYCEAAMRILKDVILGRLRAYNTVQLFNTICKDFEAYYKRKLAFIIHNRIRNCRSRLRVKPGKLKDLVAERLYAGSKNLFKVRNTTKNTEYIVDSDMEFCSCKVGMNGAPCKHQLAVVITFKISHQQFLPTSDPHVKMILYYIMTGETTAPEGLFKTLKGGMDEDVHQLMNEGNTECENMNLDDASLEVSNEVSEDVTAESVPVPQSNLSSMKDQIMKMAEDLCERLSSSEDYLTTPVEKYLKKYWEIVSKSNYDSTLASSLATFGKDQSVLKPLGRKKVIRVQPTSIARRTTFHGGSSTQRGGRPQKTFNEHPYTAQRKRPCASGPTWAVPPKKSSKVPHSLSACVNANVRLPK